MKVQRAIISKDGVTLFGSTDQKVKLGQIFELINDETFDDDLQNQPRYYFEVAKLDIKKEDYRIKTYLTLYQIGRKADLIKKYGNEEDPGDITFCNLFAIKDEEEIKKALYEGR